MKSIVCILSLALVPMALSAQASAVYTGEGWEAFPNIEYQGGDASMTRKRVGMLVLNDSILAFHACRWQACVDAKKGQAVLPYLEEPLLRIPLSSIKEVSNDTQVRSATKTRKFLIGGLASDRTMEFVSIVYETATSAETPAFQTLKSQSASIEAKVKFKMKKLGLTPP